MNGSTGRNLKLTPAALGDILADAIADPSVRARLFSAPEEELRRRGFEDSPKAVALLRKLAEVRFDATTNAQSKHHPINWGEGEGEGEG